MPYAICLDISIFSSAYYDYIDYIIGYIIIITNYSKKNM